MTIKPLLSERYSIRKPSLFGSVARNEANSVSDLDILPVGSRFLSSDLTPLTNHYNKQHSDNYADNNQETKTSLLTILSNVNFIYCHLHFFIPVLFYKLKSFFNS